MLSGLNFIAEYSIVPYLVFKGRLYVFQREGDTLGDLSGAMSYPTFSGVNVYFVDYVTCCAGD